MSLPAPRQALPQPETGSARAWRSASARSSIGGPHARQDRRSTSASWRRSSKGELDHVTPDELADWIVAGRQDYRLIDLRTAAEYASLPHPAGGECSRSPRSWTPIWRATRRSSSTRPRGSTRRRPGSCSRRRSSRRSTSCSAVSSSGPNRWSSRSRPAQSAGPAERIAFAKAAERAKFFGGASRARGRRARRGARGASHRSQRADAAQGRAAPAPAPGGAAAKKKKEGC